MVVRQKAEIGNEKKNRSLLIVDKLNNGQIEYGKAK